MIVSGRKLCSMLIFAVNEQMAAWQLIPLLGRENEIHSVGFLIHSSFSKLIRKFYKPACALYFNLRKSVSLSNGIILSLLSQCWNSCFWVFLCVSDPCCQVSHLPGWMTLYTVAVFRGYRGVCVAFPACYPGVLVSIAPVQLGWETHLPSLLFVPVPRSKNTTPAS